MSRPPWGDAGVLGRVAFMAGVLLVVAIGLVVTMGDRLAEPPAPPPPPVVIATPPPPPQAPPKPAAPPILATATLEGPFDPIDAVSFTSKSAGEVVLDELTGPGPEAVCADDGKLRWACGLRARAALTNALRDQTLTCDVLERIEKRRIRARCRNRDGDLARQLVAAGWARPGPEQEQKYARELEAAKAAHAGLWTGGWTIVLQGRPGKAAKPKT